MESLSSFLQTLAESGAAVRAGGAKESMISVPQREDALLIWTPLLCCQR